MKTQRILGNLVAGAVFGALGLKVLAGMQQVFQTRHPVVIYPASGTGAFKDRKSVV